MTLIKTKQNRRSFLKASALAGGGFMLGFSWSGPATAAPGQIGPLAEDWSNINAFLKSSFISIKNFVYIR